VQLHCVRVKEFGFGFEELRLKGAVFAGLGSKAMTTFKGINHEGH
jgi:hypothetical protein